MGEKEKRRKGEEEKRRRGEEERRRGEEEKRNTENGGESRIPLGIHLSVAM